MKYIKSVFTKVQNCFLIAALICTIVGLILTAIGVKIAGKRVSDNLASRWSKDNNYVQVSCYFSEMSGFDSSSIKEIAYRVEQKLDEDSLDASNANARRWVYGYCANGNLTVSSMKSDMNVSAVGVGGDFFLFNPLNLVEGSYFSDDSGTDELVIIDEDIAWALFGSNNVVGQSVNIGDTPHTVCGVIKRESGRINDMSGNGVATIYVAYNCLVKYGNANYINTYEALMPNPITGYAAGALKEIIPIDQKRYELIENTGRYNWIKLLKNVKNYGIRGMNSKAVVYPYWENVSRATEDYLTPLAVISVVLFGFSGIVLIVLVIRMWQKRTIRLKNIKCFIEDRVEIHREKKRLKGKRSKHEEI